MPAHAQHGLVTPFDWQKAWGTINPDTDVRSDLNDIKNAINGAVNRCGIGKTNYDLIKVYTTEIAGITVYLVDGAPYFAQGQSATCDAKPCESGRGCILDIMGPEITSTRTTACKTGTCKETVNNYPLIGESYVQAWSVISTDQFAAIREARKSPAGKKYKYMSPNAAYGNVLTYQLQSSCTMEEMDIDNDGNIGNEEPCIKYYQYNGARLIDLFMPEEPDELLENDTRYEPKTVYKAWYGKDPTTAHNAYDRSAAAIDITATTGTHATSIDNTVYTKVWREGPKSTDGETPFGSNPIAPYRLEQGATQAYQFGPFTKNTGKSNEQTIAYTCDSYTNAASAEHAVFVPTATDQEYQSFRDSVIAGTVPGVTQKDCERNFTKWVGKTDCSQVSPPCNSSITIVATRQCQRSSSAYGVCGECASLIDDKEKFPADWPKNTCFFRRQCSGPPCRTGSDCLASHAQVLMADGSYKTLDTVKVGDKVMGFRKNAPLAELVPATVTSITETPRDTSKQPLYEVNGVPLTSGHKVLTAKGLLASASNLRTGNKVVGISGNAVKVEKAARNKGEFEKVYSITLDSADGFIVNGIRLLSK
ncbi:MAG: Hint domain-containing protein [Bdellovibrionales bacterium]